MKKYGLFMAFNHMYKILEINDSMNYKIYNGGFKPTHVTSNEVLNTFSPNYFIVINYAKYYIVQLFDSCDKASIKALLIRQLYFERLKPSRFLTTQLKENYLKGTKSEIDRIQRKLDRLAQRYPEEFL